MAAEALDHLVSNVPLGHGLPKELKKRIAAEIKLEPNELVMWDLADAGWRDRARARLAPLMEERNRKLNTPKSNPIDELFDAAIGLSTVSTAWRWKRMSVVKAREKLDKHVTLRGDIAHRGAAAASVRKAQVSDYLRHVKRLVAKTGGRVNTYVETATGKALW